jgi:hypothetical protein
MGCTLSHLRGNPLPSYHHLRILYHISFQTVISASSTNFIDMSIFTSAIKRTGRRLQIRQISSFGYNCHAYVFSVHCSPTLLSPPTNTDKPPRSISYLYLLACEQRHALPSCKCDQDTITATWGRSCVICRPGMAGSRLLHRLHLCNCRLLCRCLPCMIGSGRPGRGTADDAGVRSNTKSIPPTFEKRVEKYGVTASGSQP